MRDENLTFTNVYSDQNDKFVASVDGQHFDGMQGIDTAVFSGVKSDYFLRFDGATVTLALPATSATLRNVEFAEFADQTIDLRNGPTATASELYRFVNTELGTHFYTSSEAERDTIIQNLPQFQFEGNAFGSNATAENGGTPVYRFYNTQTGVHFYTTSEVERDSIIANLPQFADEGISYYSYDASGPDNVPLYRFYNTENGTHFFTANEAEKESIRVNLPQYNFEGTAYYVDIA